MKTWMAIAAAAAASLAAQARADSPMPELYLFEQPEAGTVIVTVHNYAGRACPDDGLLRKDATGNILEIRACQGDKFVDECVPAGEYQYGLATPLACHETAGTEFYGTVTVSTGAAPGCTRTVQPAPEDAAAVPWGTDPQVCASTYGKHGSTGCSSGGAVLGTNLALLLAGLALWRRRGRSRA